MLCGPESISDVAHLNGVKHSLVGQVTQERRRVVFHNKGATIVRVCDSGLYFFQTKKKQNGYLLLLLMADTKRH